MTLRLLSAEDLVKQSSTALAFLDTPQGAVLASGPVRPVTALQRTVATALPENELTFHLGRTDAAAYHIRIIGHGPALLVRRTPSPQRIALREINLPADRPVLLVVEALEEFEPDALTTLARLVDGLGRPPLLCPGSALGVPEF